MKIGTQNDGLYGVGTTRSTAAQRVDRGAMSPASRRGDALLDRVEVSDAAAMISRILERSDALRATEITSLTLAYGNGTLRVNSYELGRAVLSDSLAQSRLGDAA